MVATVTDHYFKFGVHKYFRGNAHMVVMGTYGEKKDPIGPKAYIDPENNVARTYLCEPGRVTEGQPVSVNWSQTSKGEVEVNGPIKAFGLDMSVAVSYTYEQTRRANLQVYNLFITEGKLKSMLNNDANGARNYLADEGADGRIVSEIWVVMEAELSEHFDTSGSFLVAENNSNLRVTAKGGTHGTQTITLSAGTTFAYKLHKVKKWKNNKTVIEDMEADYKGMG